MIGLTGVMVFALIWWLVLFTILPIGVRAQENPVPGTPKSAPAQPRIITKFIATTLVAALVWLALWAAITNDLFGLAGYLHGDI